MACVRPSTDPTWFVHFILRLELILLQNPDELFEVMSQCLLSAVDRDALSGWGAEVIIM
jgi:hypothetical protein